MVKIDKHLTDDTVLKEIGRRFSQRRLDLSLSQADLAEQSGLAKRTIERIESGGSTQMLSIIRVLRALDLLERLNLTIPESNVRPMDLLKLKGKVRKRVSRSKQTIKSENVWHWGDEK